MTFNIGDKVRLKTYEEVAPLYPHSTRKGYEEQPFYKEHVHDVFTITSAKNGLTFAETSGSFNERCFALVQNYKEPSEEEVLSMLV